ncbi:restriction endonuclease [Paenibacillus sp. 79R4]|uniref:restriction endonuclease n=1 Tax=Paenibacillus sp. 79R4 TaxID=2212847 RepID=UPI0015BC8742|nr:restriction endonuclease [Paenibacillus sp. 79R4]NWL89612.1 restriction endonuclease [Paenibacillus sp. 79R4]
MVKYFYEQYIVNEYLGVSKTIKGNSSNEVLIKAEMQKTKWKEQEKKARQREHLHDLKLKAELDSIDCKNTIEDYRNILLSTIYKDDKLQWDSLMNHDQFKPFKFEEQEPSPSTYEYSGIYPSMDQLREHLNVPKDNWINKNLPILKNIYQKRFELANNVFQTAVTEYEKNKQLARKKYEDALQSYIDRKTAAIERYEKDKKTFEETIVTQNQEILEFRKEFESNNKEAVIKYVDIVLERSIYPDSLYREYEIFYDEVTGTLVVEYRLPNINEVPKVIGYKYVASRKSIDSIEMKPKDLASFYEDTIYQISLRTIHEIFESVYIPQLQMVVFNGWINGIDLSTGHDFTSCILSVQVNRDAFEEVNLERVDPKECFRSFKGLTAGALSQMAPVKPIMQLNKEDNRFIESKEILAEINDTHNLAEMPWEDFEHLIRELFSKIFSSDGGEVNVTRASRDGGVDAIAFDPDPIRGGKFVIQAKRYNNVVGVSAVRDLYGTMINEGAVKGILVTTSHFGNDSREFVKDKPITLIDGPNLLHLFNQQGYKVRIDIQTKTK